ncbi:PhnA domain-containing protein [Candidatus Gracilibacteria bacterium]|nr:PhnA domain-containing protein [Candidatus Gracilibacteria bacterium]MBS9784165.1 PhnA domain-containing protein [Candidatus Gracilibacteria bacterium]
MAKKKYDWYAENNDTNTSEIEVFDANGNRLQSGDSVIAIKPLKIKGGGDIKKGEKFKNIRLTDNPEEIECGKIVLRTEFFKKV